VLAPLRLIFGVKSEMDQGIVALARFHDHIAAMAAVAARRTPAWNVGLAAKGNASIPAVTSLNPNCCLIDEHCNLPWVTRRGAIAKILNGSVSACKTERGWDAKQKASTRGRGFRPLSELIGDLYLFSLNEGPWKLLCFDRLDRDELAHAASIQKPDAPRDLGEKRVVLASANIQAGLHSCSPLSHDDGAAGNELSPECFKAQSLSVRIAAVT
jgi:hypothetical protein